MGLKETFDDYSKNIITFITKTENMIDLEKNNTKKYIFKKISFDKIIFIDENNSTRDLLKFINYY